VDKLVLTGSADTGRHLLSQLSQNLTPATMELSGCDAVFVLPDADLDRLARCLVFGLRFNGGATCMAPRRVFVPWALKQELERRLSEVCSPLTPATQPDLLESVVQHLAAAIEQGARLLTGSETLASGGKAPRGPVILTDATPEMQLLRTDVLAPLLSLVPVASIEDALLANSQCPFALGAAVFGGARSACHLARRIDAGCVVINDLIAPTADPRVPLAGRRQSGFGVTRGAAGLEEMTLLKAIVQRRGNWLAHLEETTPWDVRLLADFLGLIHGRDWRTRLGHACSAVRTAINQRKWKKTQQHAGRKVDVG
jgi:acyl-CoA reductase-like NAD-dependent aldehyde dehydrogenase